MVVALVMAPLITRDDGRKHYTKNYVQGTFIHTGRQESRDGKTAFLFYNIHLVRPDKDPMKKNTSVPSKDSILHDLITSYNVTPLEGST